MPRKIERDSLPKGQERSNCFHPRNEKNEYASREERVKFLHFYLIQALNGNSICTQEDGDHRSPNFLYPKPLLFPTHSTGDKND